jgi:acyl-CoA thioester hydrolase
LRSLGFEQDRLIREQGIVFAVRSARIDYLRPARFNDLLNVISELQHRGRASLTFNHTVVRQHEASQPCCSGEVKIACIDANSFRPQPLPETLLKELADDS